MNHTGACLRAVLVLHVRWRRKFAQGDEWHCWSRAWNKCMQGKPEDKGNSTDSPSGVPCHGGTGTRGECTLAELAQRFGVGPNQVMDWKRQLDENAANVFDATSEPRIDEGASARRSDVELVFAEEAMSATLLHRPNDKKVSSSKLLSCPSRRRV